MKTQLILSSLIIIILIQIVSPSNLVVVMPNVALSLEAQATDRTVTVGQPAPADALARRQQIEEQILRATIRVYIETWTVKPDESGYDFDVSVSHATLKDGRFLVTHNHFTSPMAVHSPAGGPDFAAVTLANSAGEALYTGPLSDFELVWEDPETLVVTHKEDDLFERLGFVSAEFIDWSSASLAPGSEVAQVDWDGTMTRVDWTTVQEIAVDDGVPRLVLADDITLGASGGGIFWQGKHVANNWLLVQELEASGELINASTKVALNSASVAHGPSLLAASK